MTLLISPLLALMRNQVAAAERVGVKCFTINSTNPNEWDGIRAKILAGGADLLIVSPERLANDNFRATILEPITNKIGLLVIDEAHCVSDWGHDFRPDYKKISRLLEHLPRILCGALESPAESTHCERCANCRPEMRLPVEVEPQLVQRAADILRKSCVPIEPRRQWADAPRAAKRFGLDGKTTIPSELRMEEGRALSLYNAGEWGRLVRIGKYESRPARFDDRLVEACARMLAEWTPVKQPQFIVPIPSQRDNALVGDFAIRLARRLRLPCVSALAKTMDTPPQKNMENGVFLQDNVIDAFAVTGSLPKGGCLLIDDMVDSRWTFTVAAATLRQAGVEFVIPLALANSSNEGE